MQYPPLPVAAAFSRFWAKLLDVAIPRLRRTAVANLRMAGMRESIADEVFESIARVLLTVSRIPKIDRPNIASWIAYEGFEHYEEAKRKGRGVLFATAHLGNWELSAHAHSLLTEPMNVVVRPLDNPVLDAFVEERRGHAGNRVITKRNAARLILSALRRNEAVGILVDQHVLPEEGVVVDFFGAKAWAGKAFVRIAHHSGATVIPGFALWRADLGRYVLRFYPPVEITGDVAGDTQRLHAVLESVIREYPGQWLWVHRRWR